MGGGEAGVETPPKQTATVADGTHPTGMHSFTKNLSLDLTILGKTFIEQRLYCDGLRLKSLVLTHRQKDIQFQESLSNRKKIKNAYTFRARSLLIFISKIMGTINF